MDGPRMSQKPDATAEAEQAGVSIGPAQGRA
jgi:hypothetical protein